MNVKQKFEDLKTKVRENLPQIITAVSVGVTVVTAVAMMSDATRKVKNANKTVDEAIAVVTKVKEAYETFQENPSLMLRHDTVFLLEETKKEIREGSNEVWFDVDGDRFDMTLHTED